MKQFEYYSQDRREQEPPYADDHIRVFAKALFVRLLHPLDEAETGHEVTFTAAEILHASTHRIGVVYNENGTTSLTLVAEDEEWDQDPGPKGEGV